MSKSAHLFVATIFTILGLSFVASSVFLFQEFQVADPWTMVVAHSHLFIFFPLLGIVALAAFYLPSVIFTDHYWFHLGWHGPVRFVLGFAAVAAAAWYQTVGLNSQELRAIWEVSPAELAREASQPMRETMRCTDVAKLDALRSNGGRAEVERSGADITKPCGLQPILMALQDLREHAQHRTSLSGFSRNCSLDPLLEPPPQYESARYCFPAGQKLNAADCCRVQQAFREHVTALYKNPVTRSKSADLEVYFLVLKVFFIQVLFVIGVFLLIWRSALKTRYAQHLPAMERGVVIGAVAMLFWMLMDYGYQQTTDVLFGRHYNGINPRLSLAFLPWALVLLFYFMERLGKDLERVAQMATILGAGVTILRYQEINDWSARLFGVGAAWWQFVVLGVLGLGSLVVLAQPFWERRKCREQRPAGERH